MNTATKLLTAGSLVLALGACASQPTQVAQQTDEPKKDCVRATGTHLERDKEHECVIGPGRTYTREDMDRSGAMSTGDAIRRLRVR